MRIRSKESLASLTSLLVRQPILHSIEIYDMIVAYASCVLENIRPKDTRTQFASTYLQVEWHPVLAFSQIILLGVDSTSCFCVT